jgi:hypothetical protein
VAEKLRLTSKNILCVEGKDDLNFFRALLSFENIRNVQVIEAGGKDKFPIRFKTIANEDNFSETEMIGFIRDAELLPAKSAFDSICSILDSLDIPYPVVPGDISTCIPNIGIFIMPDNQKRGMLEDLCLCSVSDYPSAGCIDTFVSCYEKQMTKEEKAKYNPSKAKALSYLATRAPIQNCLGLAALNNFWDFHHRCFNKIKDFLHTLFD